jgi:hypothetical protein
LAPLSVYSDAEDPALGGLLQDFGRASMSDISIALVQPALDKAFMTQFTEGRGLRCVLL